MAITEVQSPDGVLLHELKVLCEDRVMPGTAPRESSFDVDYTGMCGCYT